MADVAQLVERRVVVPNVVGSSPIVRPKYKSPGLRQGIYIVSRKEIVVSAWDNETRAICLHV